ncbi:MAG: hypothetical protein E6H84_00280 [Chloroflexi bacterium]|nr:MAG: hypothetical protein E6H84_00280 [Chloroflexota bacterium]
MGLLVDVDDVDRRGLPGDRRDRDLGHRHAAVGVLRDQRQKGRSGGACAGRHGWRDGRCGTARSGGGRRRDRGCAGGRRGRGSRAGRGHGHDGRESEEGYERRTRRHGDLPPR